MAQDSARAVRKRGEHTDGTNVSLRPRGARGSPTCTGTIHSLGFMNARSGVALVVSVVATMTPLASAADRAAPIDRHALVTRHNPVVRKVDVDAPLTVGNGGFAFGCDITGLQT